MNGRIHHRRHGVLLPVLLIPLCILGDSLFARGKPKPRYQIGLIAKSESNPVFVAARVGAEDAARELSAKNNIEVTILWRTPAEEDAQKQADLIEQLRDGVPAADAG